MPQRSHSCSQGPSAAPRHVRPGAGASCSSTEASDLPQALHFGAARTRCSGPVLLLLPLPGVAPSSHGTVTISPSCNMHLWGAYLSRFPVRGLGFPVHGLKFPVFSKRPDLSASLFPLPECRRVPLRGRGPEDQRHAPRQSLPPCSSKPGQVGGHWQDHVYFRAGCGQAAVVLTSGAMRVAGATRLSVKTAPPIPDLPLKGLWVLDAVLNSPYHTFLF